MTECERFLANGLFSPDFFKSEVRCGFFITEDRKKTWAVMLDLVLQVDAVCQKHGLTYWLAFGSLLGAVRHRGFVPWDDDIDIMMPRADFDKLIRLGDEFPHPYFLQTPDSDPMHGYACAQLRNSNTTGIAREFLYRGMNMGIALDINVLDEFPDVGGEDLFARIKDLIVLNSTFMRLKDPNPSPRDKVRIAAYPGGSNIERFKLIHNIGRQCAEEQCSRVFISTALIYGIKRDVFSKKCFEKTERVSFEGFELPIPFAYDEILKITYGDYMRLPPEEQRGTWHDTKICEPDVPYREYLARIG